MTLFFTNKYNGKKIVCGGYIIRVRDKTKIMTLIEV